MTSFLSSVIRDLKTQVPDLSALTFILPSKRAGSFLRMEISRQTENPVFSPSILSIEEFSEKISQLSTLDNTTTLFEFYSIYKETTPEDQIEDFENFTNWAQTLIHDFNEIDRYLIPADRIFSYLSEIQDINHWSLGPNKTDLVKNYLAFWKKLPEFYEILKTKLLQREIGYQGLVYKTAAEKIEEYARLHGKTYIFLGFNALNTAEQYMIQKMLEHGAKIYWDIDEVHFKDTHHDVSLFIREYAKNWPYYQTNTLNTISSNYNTAKNIEITGIAKSIGQAKYVAEILSKMTPAQMGSTALVLGDESLLMPVLTSLPENVPALNITMGYPLKFSQFSSLFDMLFQIFKTGETTFYYKDVISILSNSVIQKVTNNRSNSIILQIKEKNLLYLTHRQIAELFGDDSSSLIALLFPKEALDPPGTIIILKDLVTHLKSHFTPEKDPLNLEFLYHYHELINKLEQLVQEYPHIKSIASLYTFYKEINSTQAVDFQGKPFQGLQLMGMLESRVLDFETVILTSVDEGTLPAGKSNNSFIPYELKKSFGLPTYKEKDAVYTYHFYHLLQRAKNIYLLHNTDNESQMGGEKSRFLLQLEIEKQPHHNLTFKMVTPGVPPVTEELEEVEKTPEILNKIKHLAERGFSPSALTTYIRNPLDFYKQYILGIRDKDEVEETVAYNTLGTVVHDSLETFYSPLENQVLKQEHIADFKARVTGEVKLQFEKTYSKAPLSRGKNLLIFEVAKRYINNFLKMESREMENGNLIEIKQIETNLKIPLAISQLDFPVAIRGKVDRVDVVNGTLRIIDYKTGKVEQSQLEIIDWEELTTDYNKYAKPFQVLMYALMLLEDSPSKYPVEAGVISFKNLKSGFLKFGKKEQPRDKNKQCLVDEEILENFKVQLKNLIIEICDPKIPFLEKEIKTSYGNF
ncbi:PD-(D/E)XK nuclease family protein [Antarcticibacterium arcticum]|uniref:PD-(D/E)XK nuclease family protein n=1 Tax=Antarcticibacterium arcticum TaxID=2585771 RepID=A0A5B8YQW5_9FLAO|nr:PD-(D/E)XK nuclease family protein [Antarcticibacterium arcticum]QED38389.1 PD-(D/E)XK nuclease family protein [Antarcticibacterium arcticum]